MTIAVEGVHHRSKSTMSDLFSSQEVPAASWPETTPFLHFYFLDTTVILLVLLTTAVMRHPGQERRKKEEKDKGALRLGEEKGRREPKMVTD